MHAWWIWWDRLCTGYSVVMFNSQYTFQEGTRLRGLQESTLEHDPPVQVTMAAWCMNANCFLNNWGLHVQHNGLLANV